METSTYLQLDIGRGVIKIESEWNAVLLIKDGRSLGTRLVSEFGYYRQEGNVRPRLGGGA